MPNNSGKGRNDLAGVLVLAHCLLNQATRWWQYGKAPRDQGPVNEVLAVLSSRRIGAVQLPCPEFTFCGNPRPPRTKDDYENIAGFRLHCERLADTTSDFLRAMVTVGEQSQVRILAVVGVKRSPTCGVKCTPSKIDKETEYVEEKGLFFEILEKRLENLGLKVPFIEIDLQKPAEFRDTLEEILR